MDRPPFTIQDVRLLSFPGSGRMELQGPDDRPLVVVRAGEHLELQLLRAYNAGHAAGAVEGREAVKASMRQLLGIKEA
jgi:hypothetical protein